MYSIQRHYIRKVSGLQMSRSLEIHSTDSSLYCNTSMTLRTVSDRGTYSLIWTVNCLEPNISYVLESQTFKQTSIYTQPSLHANLILDCPEE
jgi:hypothetical protein